MAKILIKKDRLMNINFKKEGTQGNPTPIRYDIRNISIVSDKDKDGKVVLMAEDLVQKEIIKLVKATAVGSHKHIIGEINVTGAADAAHMVTLYNSGGDVHLTNGALYNTQLATPGDIIFLVGPKGSNFTTEEALISASKTMIILTLNNVTLAEINKIKTDTSVTKDTVKSIKDVINGSSPAGTNGIDPIYADKSLSNLDATGQAIIDGKADKATVSTAIVDLTARTTASEGKITGLESTVQTNSTRVAANDALSKANKVEIDKLDPKVISNEEGILDYFHSKADFLVAEDLTQYIKNLGDQSKPVKSGKDYTWTLTPAMVHGFSTPHSINVKINDGSTSEYFKDSFNDGNSTTVHVGNREFTATLTDKTFVVHTNEDLTNMKLMYLEMPGGTVTGTIDNTARAKGDAAMAKAILVDGAATANKTALALLQPKVTANGTLIGNNSTAINAANALITANKNSITTKQSTSVPSLPTTSKTIEGAIKEINSKADLTKNLAGSLRDKDIMKADGTFVDLNTMDETGVGTDEDKVLITVKAVRKLIADALSTAMHVTFDDKTSGDYKIGK